MRFISEDICYGGATICIFGSCVTVEGSALISALFMVAAAGCLVINYLLNGRR